MKLVTTTISILGLSLGLGLAACGGSSSCDTLAKKVCAGKDAAKCKAWLDGEMTGPKGEKLSKDEANQACKMILDDQAALDAYTKQAADKVK